MGTEGGTGPETGLGPAGEADASAPDHETGTESASTGDATDEIGVVTAMTDEEPIGTQSLTPDVGAALLLLLLQTKNLPQETSLR